MTVTFCGHSDVESSDVVEQWLHCVVRNLISEGASVFYLGGYGGFDRLAAAVVRKYAEENAAIQVVLVLPYINNKLDTSGYTSTIYPELEKVPPRYAISRRNRWMVEQADVVVAYVLHSWGGAAATLKIAQGKHKRVIHYESSKDRNRTKQ